MAHDPRLLYSVNNILAFHLQDGEESELTASGPQTLSLLMVPTTTTAESPDAPAEEDFYLHLHLPPELDFALPATTQIYHQPPHSYLIPRWDLGPDSGAFIRIQFPGIGEGPEKVSQEEVDTFETILAQCTAFLERAEPPKGHAPYVPAEYGEGEGYVSSGTKPVNMHGKIVLVDEEDGSVVGELTEGYNVVEKPDVKPGSKSKDLQYSKLFYADSLDPVEFELPAEGEDNAVTVDNVSEEYLEMARHPAYQNSTLVQQSATASRLVVTGSSYISNVLTKGAESFIRKTKPNPKPLTFTDATHTRIRKIGDFSHGAAGFSSKAAGQVGKYAQNLGASLSRRKENDKLVDEKSSKPVPAKPGMLNRSMIAFSTLTDGLEHGAKNVLASGATAANTMINHRYGAEAGSVASNLTGGFKNVGLVYIDATGVSRKAVMKSVAKGMVVGRMHDGQQVVVGTGDGGEIPPSAAGELQDPVMRGPSPNATAPPAYGASGAQSLGGTPIGEKK